MFSILAGVRSGDDSTTLFTPKGLPKDLGWESKGDNRNYISDDDGEGNVSKERAAKWVAEGYSKIEDEYWVTNPDWHSHSWLTPDEYQQAVECYQKIAAPHGYHLDAEYITILDCLRSFEKQGKEARLVFWFDN